MHTAQRIAYAYGFLGKQAQLRKLAANKAVLAIEAEANLPLYVGVFGLAGAVDAANRLAEPLAAEMMAAIASAEPLKLAGRGSDIDLWFSRLLKTQQRLRLVELIGKWECDDIRLLGEGNKLSGRGQATCQARAGALRHRSRNRGGGICAPEQAAEADRPGVACSLCQARGQRETRVIQFSSRGCITGSKKR